MALNVRVKSFQDGTYEGKEAGYASRAPAAHKTSLGTLCLGELKSASPDQTAPSRVLVYAIWSSLAV